MNFCEKLNIERFPVYVRQVVSKCCKEHNDGIQQAQLKPSDRAMRLVANYHATVQKLLMR